PEGLLAVNTLAPTDRLATIDYAPLHARLEAYQVGEPQDLRGPVLVAALGLLALDALVVFLLAGGIGQILRRRPQGATAAMLLAAVLLVTLTFGSQAFAQQQQAQGDLLGPMINRAIIGTPPREQRGPSEPLSSGDADFA